MLTAVNYRRLCFAGALIAAGSITAPAQAAPRDREVSFEVRNLNRSQFPCDSDGREYRISGHLVTPRRRETQSRALTLLVHGAEVTSEYMRFDAVPGYDFQAALARRGHASVAIDRLGFGESGHPRGDQVCYGSQADAIHQVIEAVRAGRYRASGGPSRRFERIALAAHSAGTPIAEIEAASFQDVDALIAMSWGAPDTLAIVPNLATSEFLLCPLGGARSETGATGYAYQWPSASSYRSDVFYDVEPRVLAASGGLRRRSPCGDISSNVPMAGQEPSIAAQIEVPVLVAIGDRDALFPPPAGPRQLGLFSASPDRQLVTLSETGHTVFLERTARRLQREVSSWLERRGF